nr:hypothetical protein [uncultured Methanoregula sp.]
MSRTRIVKIPGSVFGMVREHLSSHARLYACTHWQVIESAGVSIRVKRRPYRITRQVPDIFWLALTIS